MIPIEKFGQDHWSTFLYLESRVVDHDGVPQKEHMRCDPRRHPWHAHRGSFGACPPTKIRASSPDLTHDEVRDHDDWDCAEDLVTAGLLVQHGTATRPVFALTDEGWRVVGHLRRWRAEGEDLGEFEVPRDCAATQRDAAYDLLSDAEATIRQYQLAAGRAGATDEDPDFLSPLKVEGLFAYYVKALTAANARPRIAVAVLVLREQEGVESLLLGKRLGSRGTGFHGAPGGLVESDETPAQAAARELHEETGIVVAAEDLTDTQAWAHTRLPTGEEFVTLYFTVTVAADTEAVNTEPTKCAGWVWYRRTCCEGEGLPTPLFESLRQYLAGCGGWPRTEAP